MSILIDKSTRLLVQVSQAGMDFFMPKRWLNTEQMWWAEHHPAKEEQ